ncbi:MAG: hypothetical protein JST68_01815 [Bacteroidetes bacterium]|nr:hypothetical protein [Bacteroidota bacterium]
MKSILLFAATLLAAGAFAQTTGIGGRFKKSDGNAMKPATPNTFPMIIFSDQVLITNLTGGSDNTATIEIETPTNTNVGEFRNMMNTASPAKTITALPQKVAVPATKANIGDRVTQTIQKSAPAIKITRAEITIAKTDPAQYPKNQLVKTILLEDVTVESCTDDAATGKSKIRLKGSRIGWIYYSYDKNGNSSSTKSGWDTGTNTTWTSF